MCIRDRDYAVMFIEILCHTKGTWARKPFELIDWQEQIIRDIFGVLKPNGYRQFNTAYIEIPKKQGKSELAAAVALLLTCGDGEERAEVYGCAADRQQASIVFNVAADMVRMCPALSKRVKILAVSYTHLDGKPTKLQEATIRKILAAGGTALVVRSVDEVRTAINLSLIHIFHRCSDYVLNFQNMGLLEDIIDAHIDEL